MIHISQRISHNRYIADYAKLILKSVHVVGEIVLTDLLCKFQIYFALTKATVPDLTDTSIRISR